MAKKVEQPIFYDHGGRRWRLVKLFIIVIVSAVAGFAWYVVPKVLHNVPVTPFSTPAAAAATSQPSTGSPAELAAEINRSNVPVIGTGPLARVVEVQQTPRGYTALPVYGRGGAEVLTTAEGQAVGSHIYAIERYGQTQGKQIALTFDDGPDPTWTPKILDELAKYRVQATFFEIGQEIVKYPTIAHRVAQEGHVVGSHTFDHVNFDTMGDARAAQEISQTQHVIRVATGHGTSFIRLPYGGNDDQSLRDFVRGILEAQKLGYVVTYYQYDTNDWEFSQGTKPALPTFDGSSMVVLMHDGGGDRSRTLPYLAKFIETARAHGYSFVTLGEMYPQAKPLFAPVTASLADKAAYYTASAYLVWPHLLVTKLFFVAIVSVVLSMIVNIILAAVRMRRVHFKRRRAGYAPLVSVVVPAYNEEAVLEKTVSSLLRSRYRNIEIVIVDDGSKDSTWKIARRLTAESNVRAFRKRNGGKAVALNFGIKKAAGDIVVSIDADTVFPPHTIGKLVRHFVDPQVGAVAGAVKVGNARNPISRWQALDYAVGIYIERNAQALLGAVMIVPGACGAWRKEALHRAHGYSSTTLAEDFDMTLAVHRAGYKVIQDNDAVAYTEAPLTVHDLFKQRFRWIFGNIQAFWKYRQLLLRRRHGWLGTYALPLAIFNIVAPLLFGPLLLAVELENILDGNYEVVLLFFAATIALQFIFAAIGLALAHERLRYLLVVPLTRILYGPIRSFILYRSVVRALRGAQVGWNKVRRTGTVPYEREPRLQPARGLLKI